MAMPQNELSLEVIDSPFIGGRALAVTKIRDYETGGIALNDPSEGHQVQVWSAEVVYSTDIVLSAELVAETLVYAGTDISEISITFDQNMRLTYTFVEGGSAKLRWYDTTIPAFVVTEFGSTYISPRVSLDDKRLLQMGNNDIIFAYIREGNLYFRMQRDRFGVEYLLATDVLPAPDYYLAKIGMNTKNRFQFQIFQPWTQEEIIADMLSRASDPATQGTFADTTTIATRLDTGSTTIYSQDNDTSEE